MFTTAMQTILMRRTRQASRLGARHFTGAALALVFLALGSLAVRAVPRHVYLTWQGDTSGTITVNYQTLTPRIRARSFTTRDPGAVVPVSIVTPPPALRTRSLACRTAGGFIGSS